MCWPFELGLVLQQRGDGRGAGAFGEHLFALEQREDGAGDLFFLDGNHLIHIFRDQRIGDVAGAADGDAVGDGGSAGNRDRCVLRQWPRPWKAGARSARRRLSPSGRNSLMAQATPAINPPPPTGTTTASSCGHCSSNSRPMVPCPAITAISSKGCRNVRPRSSAERQGVLAGFVVIGAVQDHLGAVILRGHHFHQRRGRGHDDGAADAAARGVIGDGLRVVSRRGGNDAALRSLPELSSRILLSAPRSL